MVRIGDEVVHQSHPGRFEVIAVEPSPGLNVYSDILTIRSADGVEMKVLDTAVRTLEPRSAAPSEPASATSEPKQE